MVNGIVGGTMNRETNKYFSKIGLVYFIGSILFSGVQAISASIIRRFMPDIADNHTLLFLIPMLSTYIIAVPLMMLVISRIPKARRIESREMTTKQWVVTFLICYAGMYVANLAGTMVTNIIGQFKDNAVSNEILEIIFSNSMWANILVAVLLAPIIEEMLFRKMLIDRTIQYGEGISVFLSALFFGLFHGNLNQFAYAFVIGGVFGFVYVKTGKIKYTIEMHMLINFLGSAVSISLMKLAGLDELVMTINDPSKPINPWEIMNIMTTHIGGFAVLGIYVMVILALVGVGIALFFKNINKIHLVPSVNAVEKGERFRTYFFNVGMIFFVLWWCVMIVWQLIS